MIKNKVDAFVEFTDPIRARYEVPRDYYNTNYPEYQRHGEVNFLPNGIQLKDSYREAVPYYRMQVTSKSLPIKLLDTVPIVLEMDIKIQSMPIYHQCYHTEKAAYGLSIVLSDVIPAESRGGKSVMLCILNTGEELVVYPNCETDSLPVSPVSLGKRVGERFRLGIYMQDGNAEILVDGISVAHFTETVVWRTMTYYNRTKDAFISFGSYGSQALSFVWQRNGENPRHPDGLFSALIENIEIFSARSIEAAPSKSLEMGTKQSQRCVLTKSFDFDPLTGGGECSNDLFCLDQNYGSVIYDMGKIADINRAELVSRCSGSRLTRNFVALYQSDDNQTYTPIAFFSMLRHKERILFYNFSAHARYLKIHTTYRKCAGEGIAIINRPDDLMSAYFSNQPLLSGNVPFAHMTQVTVRNNRDSTVYDYVDCFSLSELGISENEIEADMRDIRFRLNGWELPHYYRDGRFYVRIFEIPPKATVKLDILYGNSEAESISDGVNTLEIEYGNKTETQVSAGSWITSVEEMPDGSLITVGHYSGQKRPCLSRSVNGGRTWSNPEPIQFMDDSLYNPEKHKIDDCAGFITDKERNLVFFFCTHGANLEKANSLLLLTTRDSGYTWDIRVLDMPSDVYFSSYSDGIRLRNNPQNTTPTYVFTTALLSPKNYAGLACSAVYSKDGGETWQLSESRVNHCHGKYKPGWEKGISEDTVWEKRDGTLVMFCRYQIEGILHFAVSHSYDGGVTWEEIPQKSNIYATNTQPMIFENQRQPMLLWGGNNAMGTFSYCRFPMSIACSKDDGETYEGIQDVSFQLRMSNREAVRRLTAHEITNPDIVLFTRGGVRCAYILSMRDRILIEDFDNWFWKTKGAYDTFDCGVSEADGWITVSGERPVLHPLNKGMYLGSETKLSRSIPFVQSGTAFFDFHMNRIEGGLYLELQSAYHRDPVKAAPITLHIDSQGYTYYNANSEWIDTGMILKQGANTISISFDGNSETANLTVNGEEREITFNASVGKYICFAYLYCGTNTDVRLDCFAVWDRDFIL